MKTSQLTAGYIRMLIETHTHNTLGANNRSLLLRIPYE